MVIERGGESVSRQYVSFGVPAAMTSFCSAEPHSAGTRKRPGPFGPGPCTADYLLRCVASPAGCAVPAHGPWYRRDRAPDDRIDAARPEPTAGLDRDTRHRASSR